jgi:hypothetical protein
LHSTTWTEAVRINSLHEDKRKTSPQKYPRELSSDEEFPIDNPRQEHEKTFERLVAFLV